MAKVTITLEDTPEKGEGHVRVTSDFDPVINLQTELDYMTLTSAQKSAIALLEYAMEHGSPTNIIGMDDA